MKFLLDECISSRLEPLLTRAGHDVIHTSDRNLQGKVDDEVLSAARDEGRVLVSADTDFGELLAKQGLTLPSLVLFRQGNRGLHQRQHSYSQTTARVTCALPHRRTAPWAMMVKNLAAAVRR